MKTRSALVLVAALGALFFLGRFAGGFLSAAEGTAAERTGPKGGQKLPAGPVFLGSDGVSAYVARRDGFSETAQRLIALFRPVDSGGSAFLEALVALNSAELDDLVRELVAHDLSPRLRRLAKVVYRRWAEVDPRARLKILRGKESEDWRNRYHLTVFALMVLARTDPDEALSIAGSFEHKGRRALYIEEIFLVLMKRNPAEAARALTAYDFSSVSAGVQSQLSAQLMRSWAPLDPGAAAAFAEAIPQDRARAAAIVHLAATWGESDPVAAMRWLQGLDEGEPRVVSNAISKLVTNAIEHQPEFVREFINTAEKGALADQTLARLAQHYAETDATSALAWIEVLDDYDTIYHAGRGIIAGLPRGDRAAFEKISAAAPPGARKRLMNVFADRWAKQDPEKAIEWAKALELRERRAATEGIMDALVDSEGGTHHRELAELVDTDPNLRRTFAPYFAESWAQEDGAAAFEWANGLEWSGLRVKSLRNVVSSWGRDRAPAARRALEAAGNLTVEERTILLGELPAK